MNKIYLAISFIFLVFTINAEIISFDASNDEAKLDKIEKELNVLKNEVNELKSKSSFLDFKISGSTKIIWGVNFTDNPFAFLGGGSSSLKSPIQGFDFENNLAVSLGLNNTYLIKKNTDYDFSEILFKFKMESIKSIPYNYEPEDGDYYEVKAVDQDGKITSIYFPKNDDKEPDLTFGNYKFILEQARLNNLLGTGFFINYADVVNLDNYYGIENLTDIVKFNHDYFNHSFFSSNDIYYSFDYDDYDIVSHTSESVKFWTDEMLTSKQKPHGVSFGVDNDLSDGFHLLFEVGGASKDGFDAVENVDDTVDYGFFIKGEPRFHTDNFEFSPKLNFGFALQTDTTKENDTGWSTLSLSFALPLLFKLHNKDYISFEIDTNFKKQIALDDNAFSFTFKPEINILNNFLFLSLPIQYWYKNEKGGFYEMRNLENIVLDQSYEDHVFNIGLISGISTNKIISDTFEYKLLNKLYLTVIHADNQLESFVNEILRNEFNFYNAPFFGSYVLMDSFQLYTDIGIGLLRNARYAEVVSYVKKDYYGTNDDKTVYYRIPSKNRLQSGNVLFGEFGFIMNFTPFMSAGFSINSPKIMIGNTNNSSDNEVSIGNQNTYSTIKIWSEIKL